MFVIANKNTGLYAPKGDRKADEAGVVEATSARVFEDKSEADNFLKTLEDDWCVEELL